MLFTAKAIRTSGLRFQVDVNRRHTIATDEPLSLGGTDQGPAPHELLPAALASCVATTVALYAEKHGWEIGGPTVEVAYDPESTPRTFEVDLHLPSGLSPDRRRRLERVAAACPLRRALQAGFAFSEKSSHVRPGVEAA